MTDDKLTVYFDNKAERDMMHDFLHSDMFCASYGAFKGLSPEERERIIRREDGMMPPKREANEDPVVKIYEEIKRNRDDMRSALPTLGDKSAVDTAAGFITAYEVIIEFIEEEFPKVKEDGDAEDRVPRLG